MVSKVARPYQVVHANDTEVANALKFRKKSYGRKKELERLRLLGNYQHNLRVLETKCGQLIVLRRPSKSEEIKGEYKDFLPCSQCLGLFRKSKLWCHNKSGSFKNKETDGERDSENVVEQNYRNVQQKSKMLLLSQENPSDSSILHETFATVKSDEINMIAKNDHLIRRYGAHLAERVDKDWLNKVSHGRQQFARLVLELRRNGTETFTMILQDYIEARVF